MNNQEKNEFTQLCRFTIKIAAEVELTDQTNLRENGAADWSLIDLATMVESEYAITLTADEALKLDTIGDWITFIDNRRSN
ncbi:MAG TPA: hypothetical protein DCG57_13385 [Candidatus Riflebacteria bacterium]|jgi:acyl carrier protein|nr:hypothetical protein [Candidatus Riflebacteria bacterium]